MQGYFLDFHYSSERIQLMWVISNNELTENENNTVPAGKIVEFLHLKLFVQTKEKSILSRLAQLFYIQNAMQNVNTATYHVGIVDC